MGDAKGDITKQITTVHETQMTNLGKIIDQIIKYFS